jgi:hypothetical protein
MKGTDMSVRNDRQRTHKQTQRMVRYIIELHVRAEGSLGAFDPMMITVTATDDATALAVAAAVAEERGWESERGHIVRREKIQ